MQHIFLLGKEGFNYFKTPIYSIINEMIANTKNQYYISNLSFNNKHSKNTSDNIKNFNIHLPEIGMITYLLYDFLSLRHTFLYIRKYKLKHCSIIFFSNRIGIFLPFYKFLLKKYNIHLSIYIENDSLLQNRFSLLIPILLKISEYMCVKYANMLLFSDDYTKKYLLNSYNKLDFNLTRISYSIEFANKTFDNFLNSYGLKRYGYYLFIDKCSIKSNILFVIKSFLKSSTKNKLLILSEKNTFLHKNITFSTNFTQDKRIVYLNLKRFTHLIPNISMYCHGYIHSNFNGINPLFLQAPFKNDILNIVYSTPFMKKIDFTHVLYFSEDNFLDILKTADSYNIYSELDKKNTKSVSS